MQLTDTSVANFTQIWDWVFKQGNWYECGKFYTNMRLGAKSRTNEWRQHNNILHYWQRVQEQKQYIYCDVRHVTNDETINMYIHYYYWGPGGGKCTYCMQINNYNKWCIVEKHWMTCHLKRGGM